MSRRRVVWSVVGCAFRVLGPLLPGEVVWGRPTALTRADAVAMMTRWDHDLHATTQYVPNLKERRFALWLGEWPDTGQEAVASLMDANEDDARPRLIVMARPGAHVVELELLIVLEEGDLEDQLAYLGEHTGTPEQSEVSLRLLRHFASSVRHRKYSGIDVVVVEVERTG